MDPCRAERDARPWSKRAAIRATGRPCPVVTGADPTSTFAGSLKGDRGATGVYVSTTVWRMASDARGLAISGSHGHGPARQEWVLAEPGETVT